LASLLDERLLTSDYSCLLIVQGIACNRIVLGLLRHGRKAEQWGRVSTGKQAEKQDTARGFFTIPSEIYTKEIAMEWDIGLPSLEMVSVVDVENVPHVEPSPRTSIS
jgi:hypothetical protein